MRLCQVCSFQLWKPGPCWLLKQELESANQSNWSLIWIWKPIRASPPLIVVTYVRYTLVPYTFSCQNKLNETMLWKAFCLLSAWTRSSMKIKCSLREARGALAPLLSNDQGFQCVPQSFSSQTWLVQRTAAFCGDTKTISGEQSCTTNLSLAVSYLCLFTALPLVALKSKLPEGWACVTGKRSG